MAKAKVNIRHRFPTAQKPWITVPYGMFYNADVAEVHRGDSVTVWDGAYGEDYIVAAKTTARFGSSEFGVIMDLTYPPHYTRKTLTDMWDAEARVCGYGNHAYDRDNVIMLKLVKP